MLPINNSLAVRSDVIAVNHDRTGCLVFFEGNCVGVVTAPKIESQKPADCESEKTKQSAPDLLHASSDVPIKAFLAQSFELRHAALAALSVAVG